MKIIQSIFFILLAAFCSGCNSLAGHTFGSDPNPIYCGTRLDWHYSTHKVASDEPIMARIVPSIDLPFSFVADTLFLPFDLVEFHKPPVDPLAGGTWKIVLNRELDPAVEKDAQNYIQTEKLQGAMIDQFFEDGTGQHAITIQVGINGTTWRHILIYDKDNKRIKTVKYVVGNYAC